jgi:methylmalonyl-CoA/ethylmalonyl-CoA epimerase
MRGIMVLHHVGVLVSSIEASIEPFSLLGFEKNGEVVKDEERGVYILFLSDKKGASIELIQPVDERSSVYDLLNRQGPGAYHLCFFVLGEEKAVILSQMKSQHFVPVGKISPAPACDDREVGFFYSNKTGLVELLFELER